MARVRRRITLKRPDEAVLPSRLSEGVALVMKQEASGLLEQVGQWLKINRQGGYAAADIYLVSPQPTPPPTRHDECTCADLKR